MIDLVTFVSAVLFLATGYIPGGNSECATGTVVAISEEMAVVEITDHPLISDIRFPFENTLMDPNDVVVGDQVNLTYVRKLVPADVGVTDVGSWCLTRKYLDGTVVSMDENQVVVRPLPEDPLAGQVETLRFLRNNRDLQRDIGVQPGDVVGISYVRDVIPGNPPQIEAVSWGEDK